ncbi:thiol:disulfide interchange protein DsbD [Haloferula luteola]|uniref:Thiol:disulfide interchange protein DsbD n=1 Tax=Haloferula luteola TaxID=595692 RepID=A0A840V082_9BACT|nr:protein-disulfide reductase DsbD domain-containing protein [Haloferula luteola]MBB5351422.1 thiol:disulfide interchange protein DsbD [Haloferula luteola]
MKPVIFAMSSLASISWALAGVKSGHAEAELFAASEGYAAGQPVQAALKLTLDEGWHSYWVNPGDSGMPVSIEWELPDGWVAGPLLYPIPERFVTSGMVGFGYAKEIVMPVFLTPGEEAAGDVTVKAKVDWLTCDDAACIPGEATLELTLGEGLGEPSKQAEEIEEAFQKVPQPMSGASLDVVREGDQVTLAIVLPATLDGEGAELIPATPNALNPEEQIVLGPGEGAWKAVVPAHEYAAESWESLEVVLVGGKLKAPLLLHWGKEME